jgi:hypothetical protein
MIRGLVLALIALSSYRATALPLNSKFFVPKEAIEKARKGWPCFSPYCKPPTGMKYKRLENVSPRIQWMDAGGYCGSLAIQDVTLGKGVWISQQQVRDHTRAGGGHDNEILATNIELALRNLKLKYDAFDYKHLPTPQADAYRTFIKKHLVQGNGIAWMIMLQGGCYPVYPGLPYGIYSHVEPVYGIYSNHPFDDNGTWYPDDVLVHGTDADTHSYYRRFDSLPAGLNSHNCSECRSDYVGYPCINNNYGFGYAITGVDDDKAGMPLSLAVDESSEPNTREGSKPSHMHGTVTVSGLADNKSYTLYRWDSVEDAFDITKARSSHAFSTPDNATTYVYTDPDTILSSSTTYYRAYEQP